MASVAQLVRALDCDS